MRPCALGLRVVPAGTAEISDRRSQRRWTVPVASYLLAAVPMTCAVYDRVTGRDPAPGARGDLPVATVSWLDAVRCCNRLSADAGLAVAYRIGEAADGDEGRAEVAWDRSADGYRLPTEGEWQHACRAGTAGPRYGPLDEIAWYSATAGDGPRPVGHKRPNAWGLYDLLGDVWEWVWDLYDPQVYGPYRVLKGGGWCDEHWSCRVGVRRRSHPSLRIDDVGFRVARSLP